MKFANRIVTPLNNIDLHVLSHAYACLDNRRHAIDFAKEFFKYDFRMGDEAVWPPASSARILVELAARDSKQERRLRLLVRAHNMCRADGLIREALLEQLHSKILDMDTLISTDPTLDVEELFLQLISEKESPIPTDVVQKLTLKEAHLQNLKGDLMLLAHQLGQAGRCADGARVAVAFAQRLARNGEKEKAEEAFFLAFRLDRTNLGAAEGLLDFANLVRAANRVQPEAVCSARETTRDSQAAQPHENPRCAELNCGEDQDTKMFRIHFYRDDKVEDGRKAQHPKSVIAWLGVSPQGPNPRCVLNVNLGQAAAVKMQTGNPTQIVETASGLKFQSFDLGSPSSLQGHITVRVL